MLKYLVVGAGGAIGTMLRYLLSNIDYKYSVGSFPLGTFLVNITGSLVIGLLWGLSERYVFAPQLRVFALVGVLGGYTTFSTFSLESFNLFRAGEYTAGLANILLTNVIGLACVLAGYFLAGLLLTFFHKGG